MRLAVVLGCLLLWSALCSAPAASPAPVLPSGTVLPAASVSFLAVAPVPSVVSVFLSASASASGLGPGPSPFSLACPAPAAPPVACPVVRREEPLSDDSEAEQPFWGLCGPPARIWSGFSIAGMLLGFALVKFMWDLEDAYNASKKTKFVLFLVACTVLGVGCVPIGSDIHCLKQKPTGFAKIELIGGVITRSFSFLGSLLSVVAAGVKYYLAREKELAKKKAAAAPPADGDYERGQGPEFNPVPPPFTGPSSPPSPSPSPSSSSATAQDGIPLRVIEKPPPTHSRSPSREPSAAKLAPSPESASRVSSGASTGVSLADDTGMAQRPGHRGHSSE